MIEIFSAVPLDLLDDDYETVIENLDFYIYNHNLKRNTIIDYCDKYQLRLQIEQHMSLKTVIINQIIKKK